MQHPEIILQDLGLRAREVFNHDKTFPSVIQSVPITNVEKVKGEPDTSCHQLTASDYTHTRRALVKKGCDEPD